MMSRVVVICRSWNAMRELHRLSKLEADLVDQLVHVAKRRAELVAELRYREIVTGGRDKPRAARGALIG